MIDYAARWCRNNRAKGLCGCGKLRDADYKTCTKCRLKSRTRYLKGKIEGRCADCAEECAPGFKKCQKHQDRSRKYQKERRAKAIAAYGGMCKCCGETEITFLAIDHIFNDGAQERRDKKMHGGNTLLGKLEREGYPQDRYQLLCHNCNFAKRLGPCPHRRNTQ